MISEKRINELEIELRSIETNVRDLRQGFAEIRHDLERNTTKDKQLMEAEARIKKALEFMRHVQPDAYAEPVIENLQAILDEGFGVEPPKDYVVDKTPPYYDAKIRKYNPDGSLKEPDPSIHERNLKDSMRTRD